MLLKTIVSFFILYFLTGIVVLRFALANLLFPYVALSEETRESSLLTFGSDDMEVLVRVYGNENRPCLIFFPGQHGGAKRYEKELIHSGLSDTFTISILSYPAQDGAKGRVSDLKAFPGLIDESIITFRSGFKCQKLIFYGRSLGAVLALDSATRLQPDGLILESMPVSLSKSLRREMKKRWYLYALQVLPVGALLPVNPGAETLFPELETKYVAIFQGNNDEVTPLEDIEEVVDEHGFLLHKVSQGTHSVTMSLVIKDIVEMVNQWISDEHL